MSDSAARQKQLIDLEQLDSLVAAAGIAGVRDILNAFWRSSDEIFALLTENISDAEFSEAARLAHALKGSAANVGAPALSDEIRQVEVNCHDRDGAGAQTLLAGAEDLYAKTRSAFAEYLQQAGDRAGR